MGRGIAQVCAQSGIRVELCDLEPKALRQALEQIEWSVGKLNEKGKLKEPPAAILGRIHTVDGLETAGSADLAIEAVFEKLELKQGVFKTLDSACAPDALLASNTSAIPITELAAVTARPSKVLGLHFFNPVPMMPAVEVVRGVATAEETMQAGVAFVRALGKEPIRVESDVPGFLLNRINLVGYVEAIRLLEQGVGSVSDIDNGVRLAFGRRMGPLETGDLVGLDVSFGALTAIYNESQDQRFYPPQLLRRKVRAGELGRKTGRGWYIYNPDGSRKPATR